MVASAFNPSTHLADREADLCEFEACLEKNKIIVIIAQSDMLGVLCPWH